MSSTSWVLVECISVMCLSDFQFLLSTAGLFNSAPPHRGLCSRLLCAELSKAWILNWGLRSGHSPSLVRLKGKVLPWWLRWSRICLQGERLGFNPWIGKIPLEEGMALQYPLQYPTPVSLPVEFRGQRSLVCYSPWGCKESVTTKRWTLLLSTSQKFT